MRDSWLEEINRLDKVKKNNSKDKIPINHNKTNKLNN